jgi:putative transposase
MRYRAAEKLEIIRLVEHSSLPVRRTLAQIGIPRSTFYAWYERYLVRGAGALEDGLAQGGRARTQVGARSDFGAGQFS